MDKHRSTPIVELDHRVSAESVLLGITEHHRVSPGSR